MPTCIHQTYGSRTARCACCAASPKLPAPRSHAVKLAGPSTFPDHSTALCSVISATHVPSPRLLRDASWQKGQPSPMRRAPQRKRLQKSGESHRWFSPIQIQYCRRHPNRRQISFQDSSLGLDSGSGSGLSRAQGWGSEQDRKARQRDALAC